MTRLFPLCGVLLFLLAFTGLQAADVNVANAQNIALNFYKVTYPDAPGNQKATLKYTQKEVDNTADFYVFDITPANGFVIVSAHDEVTPVIAYSQESLFDPNFQQIGLSNWVSKTGQQIHDIVTKKIVPDANINSLWAAYKLGDNPISSRSGSVGPLLQTSWSQSPYYNQLCPVNPSTGQRSVTGCVATAMAQILKYWNYPAQGTGSFSYTDDRAHGYQINAGPLSANFGTTTYQWTQMPNRLTGTNSAVATLMSHCGISVAMDYSDGGSGAYVIQSEANSAFRQQNAPCAQHSFITYFSYDPATIRGVHQSSYSTQAWVQLMESELNAGRVIQYEGFDIGAGGHTWVCDGYDGSDRLHMNWGWGGIGNGYYAVGNLTVGGYSFNYYDGALIGIQPLNHTTDNSCKASSSFTYQSEGGSSIQFTNTSSTNANHTLFSTWRFFNSQGQFSTSAQVNPLVNFTGLPPFAARLTVVDTASGGCKDSTTQTINFDPNTTCGNWKQGKRKCVGAVLGAVLPDMPLPCDSGGYSELVASWWTYGGTPYETRGLFKYNLSDIPAGSIIVNAKINLYVDTAGFNGYKGQPTYGNENACYLKRVTTPWNQKTVTWNTQPAFTETDRVLLAQSTGVSQNYLDLDVTNFVRGWVADTSTNNGMLLEMIGTNYYNSMIFISPAHPDSTLWPMLEVCYIAPDPCHAHAAFVQQSLGHGEMQFTNSSTDNVAFTSSWKFYNSAGQFATSALNDPQITFTGNPPFSAMLVITDNICSDTVTELVNISECVSLQYGTATSVGANISEFLPTTNINLAGYADFIASEWTYGGVPAETRGLLKFNLTDIPVGATVVSAKLNLYANLNSHNGYNGQPMYGTSNASYIKMVTSPWKPDSVTWNTEPTSTDANQVSLAQSTSVTQNYLNLDISTFVQSWLNNPSTNYGIELQMLNPVYYSSLIFCSPAFPDSTRWPKLDVCYQVAAPCHMTASFSQQDLGNHSIQFTNTSTTTPATSVNWTFYDSKGVYQTSVLDNPLITFSGQAPFSATILVTDTGTHCLDTIQKTISFKTGINDPVSAYSLNIYPNPNNGNLFYLQLPSDFNAATTQLKVFDLMGREIELIEVSKQQGVWKIALGKQAPNGMYTVTLSDNTLQRCGKLALLK